MGLKLFYVGRMRACAVVLFSLTETFTNHDPTAITTHPGAQNSRSGSFGADNNDAGDGQTDCFTPLCACARGKNCKSACCS